MISTRRQLVNVAKHQLSKINRQIATWENKEAKEPVDIIERQEAIKRLQDRADQLSEFLDILMRARFKKGKNKLTTYLCERKYKMFLKNMINTGKILGIEIVEGDIIL